MKYKLPAGTYYIGDPCYVIPDDEWADVCLKSSGYKQFAYNGLQMFMANTAHGDGEYEDNKGNIYRVDSGTLGAVPKELCKRPERDGSEVFIDFPDGLEIEYDDGVFDFGDIHIDTEVSENEEEWM